MVLSATSFAQNHQAPQVLRVGNSGYARWMNPDKYGEILIDFNDCVLPSGWTTESQGEVQDPWHIVDPTLIPGLPNYSPDTSCYVYVQSDQLDGSKLLDEHLYTNAVDLTAFTWSFVQFYYDYVDANTSKTGRILVRDDNY